ncbi:hypothetical protein FACS1894184_09180 [Clostridia bacterium]|nr:hypothetical protein FACS1894184_09180 [Clostridia bacterium]
MDIWVTATGDAFIHRVPYSTLTPLIENYPVDAPRMEWITPEELIGNHREFGISPEQYAARNDDVSLLDMVKANLITQGWSGPPVATAWIGRPIAATDKNRTAYIDPALHDYTSHAHMKRLFFQEQKSVDSVIIDILRLLKPGWKWKWIIANTGISKRTLGRLINGVEREWDVQIIRAFVRGLPIGSLLALYIMGQANLIDIEWITKDNFDDVYTLMGYKRSNNEQKA